MIACIVFEYLLSPPTLELDSIWRVQTLSFVPNPPRPTISSFLPEDIQKKRHLQVPQQTNMRTLRYVLQVLSSL